MLAKLQLKKRRSTKSKPSISEPTPAASKAAEVSSALASRCGSSPMSKVLSPNMPIVPSTDMAEIAVAPNPTACGGKRWAAIVQNTNPSAEVRMVAA